MLWMKHGRGFTMELLQRNYTAVFMEPIVLITTVPSLTKIFCMGVYFHNIQVWGKIESKEVM